MFVSRPAHSPRNLFRQQCGVTLQERELGKAIVQVWRVSLPCLFLFDRLLGLFNTIYGEQRIHEIEVVQLIGVEAQSLTSRREAVSKLSELESDGTKKCPRAGVSWVDLCPQSVRLASFFEVPAHELMIVRLNVKTFPLTYSIAQLVRP